MSNKYSLFGGFRRTDVGRNIVKKTKITNRNEQN
jgi:hypothetical protein